MIIALIFIEYVLIACMKQHLFLSALFSLRFSVHNLFYPSFLFVCLVCIFTDFLFFQWLLNAGKYICGRKEDVKLFLKKCYHK